jgi:alpha-galactosidase
MITDTLKRILIVLLLLSQAGFLSATETISNQWATISLPGDKYFFTYKINSSGKVYYFSFPVFEINGKSECLKVDHWEKMGNPLKLNNDVTEYVLEGNTSFQGLSIKIIIRLPDDNPVVRFRYELHSEKSIFLTKSSGRDNIEYLGTGLGKSGKIKEIRLSEFNEKTHATHLTEYDLTPDWFNNNLSVMGPVLVSDDSENTFLFAYEHGSQYPDRFLEFQLNKDMTANLRSVKGNYLNDQVVSPGKPFESLWFEAGGINKGEEYLAAAYRTFILKYMSENPESRKPYIFYDTWARQEKVKYAGQSYLTTMNLDYTLKEIEVAHAMGIEVYVIDAGWFLKTGDWQVSTTLFPDTLKQITDKLASYGMKLGLWLSPTMAAVSSKMLLKNVSSRMMSNGRTDDPVQIWETEKSVGLCLVSPYWENFADKLIQLVKETGAEYFTFDGISQYGCDAPGHYHGDQKNSREERLNSYAFQLPEYLGKVIDKVTAACPKTIFDLDITEDGRCVGLGFLAHGKYLIINNGPYYHNFDIGSEWKSPMPDGNPNIFINPGAARGWFTRSVLDYDKLIPSILFLTYYLPYEPISSQMQNLASLILGQNGIWGEISGLSVENVKLIRRYIDLYKKVREDITASAMAQKGQPGDSYEVYEKINPANGRGVVVLFANTKGEYYYVTSVAVDRQVIIPNGVSVSYSYNGKAVIKANCARQEAMILFFGVN